MNKILPLFFAGALLVLFFFGCRVISPPTAGEESFGRTETDAVTTTAATTTTTVVTIMTTSTQSTSIVPVTTTSKSHLPYKTTIPTAREILYNHIETQRKASADGMFVYDLCCDVIGFKGFAEQRTYSAVITEYTGEAERIVIPEKIDGVTVRKVILDGAYTAKEIVVEGGADVYITSWKMPNLTDVWAVDSRCYLFCAEIYGEDGEAVRAALSRPTVHMRKDRKRNAVLCLGEGPTVNYEANAVERAVDIGDYVGNFDETILTSDINTQELLEWEAGWQTRDFERLGLPYKGQKCYSDQAIVIHAWQYVIDAEGEIVWELPQHARYNCEISFE